LKETVMSHFSHWRRDFLQKSMASAAVLLGDGFSNTQRPEDKPFELAEATVATLRQRLESGQDTAVSLVDKYLARIAAIDRAGPRINCMIEVNSDALEIARHLDDERHAGLFRGPLHGIPIVIKDNIDTADCMMTTAGSLALVGAKPRADAPLVTALRAAGVVILGKTNMSEWAHFRSWSNATSGWSGRGGLSRNPYVLDRSTSGSSSGTAGAVASNLAAIGIGTDTDGSIVSPSSCCGLVGIRPTLGLVSREGLIPIAQSMDTAGPMARTVTDAVLLLNVMASAADHDTVVGRSRHAPVHDYAAFLVPDGLRSARIGVVREKLFGYSPTADRIAEDALELLKREGATLVDPANIDTISQLGEPEMEVMQYEFKAGINAYLASLEPGAPVQSLADIVAFNIKNKAREMPFFGQETMVAAAKKGPLTDKAYVVALKQCRDLSRRLGIDATMETHGLDALVAPSGDPAWVIDLENGDSNKGWSSTTAAVAGYPHITVPAGHASGLPVGLSFFGRAWSEPTLIRLAYAFEQATAQRRSPRFLPTVVVQNTDVSERKTPRK
jgi:amidase